MSSHTPTMGPTASPLLPRMECRLPQSPDELPRGGWAYLFNPQRNAILAYLQRSSLISWTLHFAQAADRLVGRVLPSPRPPGDTQDGWSDGWAQRAFHGLNRYFRFTAEQQESLAAERARARIEPLLAQRRVRWERFEQSRQTMQSFGRLLDETSPAQVHLNPACCWIRMQGEPLGGDRSDLSSSVLFFLVNNEIRGLRMNLEGQVLINELADYQPCTISQWAQLSSMADAGQLCSLVRHLAEIGLVACA